MLFNSLHFIWFFVVVYALYRVLPHRAQNWLLLVASYYFYAAWDWRFLGLLLASTIVDYTCGLAMERSHGRRRALLLAASLAFNLSLLAFFKYFNFFADNLHLLFGNLGWNVDFVTVRVLLPVGISFYTFATMSYVIDVYRREIPATRDLLEFSVFVAYFPHLVAGPILRASTLLPQIHARRSVAAEQMYDGAWLIVWGYFQKVYVADNVAATAGAVFNAEGGVTGVNALLGVYAFALQIYGDFAGYTNIARGTSKLLGIELIENFRFPYFTRSPQEFWRHWHISLSTWLRDYLYIPLGGNRGSSWQTHRNLLVTMVLGGLWHGAAWTFVLWGTFHGLLLILYRAAAQLPPFARWVTGPGALARVSSWLVMFHLTCYGWLIFRAHSLNQVGTFTAALFTDFAPSTMDPALLGPVLLYGAPLLAVHGAEAWFNNVLAVRHLPLAVRYSVYVGAVYLTVLFGNFGGSDFIYFQF
jgi:alginate O-acetyltransferase complex protein AlgI